MKRTISLIVCLLMLLSASSCKPSDISTIGESGDIASSGSSSKSKSTSSTNSTAKESSSSKANVSSKTESSSKASSSQSGVVQGMTKDEVIAKIANANITKEMYERSVVYEGNKARLKTFFEKINRGENVTITSFGGSITEREGYGDFIAKWFSDTYKNITVTKKKTGVGGTPSTLGVFRMEKDLLPTNPDLVIIDFSVNDGSTDDMKEAYEGVIRKLLKAPKQPAILCIGFAKKDANNAQDIHVEIAKHYGIPYISYQDAVKPEVEAGRIEWAKLSGDNVHPNDFGSKLATDLLKYFLMYQGSNLSKITDTALPTPAPKTPNKYETAKFYNNTDLTATLSGGFNKVSDAYYGVGLGNGWKAQTPEAVIEFTLNAKLVRICYISTKSSGASSMVERFIDGVSKGTFDVKGAYDFNMLGVRELYNGTAKNQTYKLKLNSGEQFTLIGVMVLE